ncbi:DHH family phosphoesterase [Pediococcus pentosaceus]|uniref:DHH family phosphoesterase n=1 Tax=Pediococcus pentosaceus TaxID=1255 RepID=A0ABD7XA91_PEDPE|nr:DHH family phosphoesterase [Pediococcus pentosaceus]WEA58293.1 DHH family phosphoesterase [Pediococcus pentosaceus]
MLEIVEKEQHGDLIDTILMNGGVRNLDEFKHIEACEVKETDPLKIDRMQEGVKLLKYHVSAKNGIGILIDGDADGFTSAAMMYRYLKQLDVEATLISSPHKNHGLQGMTEEILNSGVDLLIIPDAGSNDSELQNELIHQYDIDIIIIDHHDIEDKNTAKHSDAVIINSQLNNMNHNFTGAGMTLLFIEAAKRLTFKTIKPDDLLLTLSAIGQVADVSDVSDMEIRLNQARGLNKNSSYLLDEYISDNTSISSHDLSFGIIPHLNAVARIGNHEQRIEVVEALANDFSCDEVPIEKRRKNKKTGKFEVRAEMWSPYRIIIDKMTKTKTKQTKLVNEAISSEDKLLIKTPTLHVLVLKDEKYKPITGLIANTISGENDVACLVLVEQDKLSGSGRGCEKLFEDFKKLLLDNNLVDFAQGHANAFGVELERENLDCLIEFFKQVARESNAYVVDKLYDMNTINKKDIDNILDNQTLFGGNVGQPLLGFKNIEVNKTSIRTRGKVLNFSSGGINFIAFNGQKYDVEPNFGNSVTFNIIGEAMRSSWGNINQVVIRDLEQVQQKVKDNGLGFVF